jgi:hypothetical protein
VREQRREAAAALLDGADEHGPLCEALVTACEDAGEIVEDLPVKSM